MMTLMIQARDQESEEDKAARRALDRGNHSMVKRFVCKHTYTHVNVDEDCDDDVDDSGKGPGV